MASKLANILLHSFNVFTTAITENIKISHSASRVNENNYRTMLPHIQSEQQRNVCWRDTLTLAIHRCGLRTTSLKTLNLFTEQQETTHSNDPRGLPCSCLGSCCYSFPYIRQTLVSEPIVKVAVTVSEKKALLCQLNTLLFMAAISMKDDCTRVLTEHWFVQKPKMTDLCWKILLHPSWRNLSTRAGWKGKTLLGLSVMHSKLPAWPQFDLTHAVCFS